jgi:hypothetical protein
MKEILLTQNQVALIDDDDYERVNQYKWCVQRTKGASYAVRKVVSGGRQEHILMHRFILGVSERKICIDHINFNGLDNRKENIRACSYSQNIQHKHARKNKKHSKYKGVTYQNGHYGVYIDTGEKRIQLFGIGGEIEAARIYNELAIKYFGEYAHLNEIPQEVSV